MATLNARLTVPRLGRMFHKSGVEWNPAIPQHPLHEKQNTWVSGVGLTHIQEAGRHRFSSGAMSFIDMEEKSYAEATIEQDLKSTPRSTMITNYGCEYDVVTMEQAYRSHFEPSTNVNLANASVSRAPTWF